MVEKGSDHSSDKSPSTPEQGIQRNYSSQSGRSSKNSKVSWVSWSWKRIWLGMAICSKEIFLTFVSVLHAHYLATKKSAESFKKSFQETEYLHYKDWNKCSQTYFKSWLFKNVIKYFKHFYFVIVILFMDVSFGCCTCVHVKTKSFC